MRIWNAFWFRRVPPHSLAAFRILFGLYLLAYFLRFAARVELRWTLAGPWGTGLTFGLVKLHPPPVFFDLLTWGTISFELSAPFLLFSRRFQLYAFALGFLFHLSIACLLHILEFLNCVCAYVLFVEPEMAKRLGNRLLRGINPPAGASRRQAQG